jgi:hypothetical protein
MATYVVDDESSTGSATADRGRQKTNHMNKTIMIK